MAKEWTVEELVGLAHQYYPANINEEGFQSAESQRRLALIAQMEEERAPQWNSFIARLRTLVPKENVWDLSRPLNVHECHRVRIYVPGTVRGPGSKIAVFGYLSIMAPLYLVFTSFEDYDPSDKKYQFRVYYEPRPETFDLQRMLERNIEETFGFTRLPNEVLFTPVPDLAPGISLLGEATLADCLFTDDWW